MQPVDAEELVGGVEIFVGGEDIGAFRGVGEEDVLVRVKAVCVNRRDFGMLDRDYDPSNSMAGQACRARNSTTRSL